MSTKDIFASVGLYEANAPDARTSLVAGEDEVGCGRAGREQVQVARKQVAGDGFGLGRIVHHARRREARQEQVMGDLGHGIPGDGHRSKLRFESREGSAPTCGCGPKLCISRVSRQTTTRAFQSSVGETPPRVCGRRSGPSPAQSTRQHNRP